MTDRLAHRGILISLVAALACVFAVTALGRTSAAAGVTITKGHVDAIHLSWEASELQLQIHDGNSLLDPAGVVFVADDSAKRQVPANSDYAFLGAAGSDIWVLPQNQNADLPWLGWDTEDLPEGVFANNQVSVRVTAVDGPGDFTLFADGAFGLDAVHVNSADGLPDVFAAAVGGHSHANWAFNEPGDYVVWIEVTATLLDGSPVGSGLHPYAFKIGAAGTATTLSVGGLANEYEPGATVTLTAVQTPPTGEEHYHWFVKKAGAADYTVVPDLIAGTYTFTASLDMEGAQIVVKLYNHDHGVIAESAAVTLHVHEHGGDHDVTLTITNFPQGFIDGQSYTLIAQHAPAVDGASYRWEALPAGADSWITINNAQGPISTPELTFTVQQAWDGFKWRAVLLDAEGDRIAESAAYEMRVSLPVPTENGLHILGLAGHYHQSAAINLTALLVPAQDAAATYRWWLQRADQAEAHVVESMSGSAFTVTAEQALHGASVTVERIVGGTVTHKSAAVVILVDDHGAPPLQVVTISGDTELEDGEMVSLSASVTPATMVDRYQWYLKMAGAQAPTAIAGANSATYEFMATDGHEGASVTVAVVGEDGEVLYGPSAAVTLHVHEDHGDHDTTLSIGGLANEYEPGANVVLTAVQTPPTGEEHYHWFVKKAGETDYTVVPGLIAGTYTFTASLDMEGAQIVVKLYNHDHGVIAESAAVTLHVHEDHGEHDTTLSIGGLANEYEPGANVVLTAVQTPPTGEEHYHWFVKKAGEADYTVVPGLIAGTYTFTASLDMEGAQIVVKLYNHDHGVIAESAASTLHVHQRPATPTPVAPAPPSTGSGTASLDSQPGLGVAISMGLLVLSGLAWTVALRTRKQR